MNAEIICVGTELLLGNILNTNAKFLSEKLSEIGISVFNETVVGDNENRLKEAFLLAFSRSDIVILTGGLGPTKDDLTKEAVCDALNIDLIKDPATESLIKEYFKNTGKEMPQNNLKQALVPNGAKILKNNNGTAPGFIINILEKSVVILPGPPKELNPMFNQYVLPYLTKVSQNRIYSQNVKVMGVGESKAAEVLGELLNGSNPTVATYAKEGEVLIRITAKAKTEEEAKNLTLPVLNAVLTSFNENVYSVKNEEIEEAVVRLLKEKNLKISTAESCTAGIVSGLIANVSGASEVFDMGVTAYSNFIKINALNVKKEIIEKYSAVSPQTAIAMAENVRKLTKSAIGVSVTGNAGPNSSENKPVGLVYIALSNGTAGFVKELNLNGSREKIRTVAAKEVLDMARRYLEGRKEFLSLGFNLNTQEEPKTFKAYSLPLPIAFNPTEAKKDEFLPNTQQNAENGNLTESGALPDNYSTAYENLPKTNKDKAANELPNELTNEETSEETPKDINIKNTDNGINKPENQNENFKNIPNGNLNKSTEPYNAETESQNTAKSQSVTEDVLKNLENELVLPSKKEEKRLKKQQKKKAKEALKNGKSQREKTVKYIPKEKEKTKGGGIFPKKGDSTGEVIRKIVFLVALLTLIVTLSGLGYYFYRGYMQKNIIKNAASDFYAKNAEEKNSDGIFVGFESLIAKNKDVKGWIKIDGTEINHPVYQSADNNYYVHHNMNKDYSDYGAIFLDKSAKVEKTGESKNLVLYGHNMNDGAMFGTLKRYRTLDFYKAHPTFSFETLYNSYTYQVFSVFVTNADKAEDNGNLFSYRYNAFASNEAFLNYISELKKRSLLQTGVKVNEDDDIITLSTCANDFKNARLVVVARKLQENEKPKSTENARTNPAPLFPAAYYKKHRGNKPSDETLNSVINEFNSKEAEKLQSFINSGSQNSSNQSNNQSISPNSSQNITESNGSLQNSASQSTDTSANH